MNLKLYFKKWMIYSWLGISLLSLFNFVIEVLSGMIYTDGVYGWIPLFTSIVAVFVYRRNKQPYITISNQQLMYGFKGNLRYDIDSLKLVNQNNKQIVLKSTGGHKKPIIKIPLKYLAPESQEAVISFVHDHIEPA